MSMCYCEVSEMAICGLIGLVAGLLLGMRVSRRTGAPQGTASFKGGKGRVELYVGNISYDTNEKGLTKAFEKFGPVTGVRIIMKKSDGHPKGYGFVEMGSQEAANAAIRGLNGKELDGRVVVVNEARTRGRIR